MSRIPIIGQPAPQQPQLLKPGFSIVIGDDGPLVLIQCTSTIAVPAQSAREIMELLRQSIERAELVQAAIEQPAGNGVIHA